MNAFLVVVIVFLLITLVDWWVKRRTNHYLQNERLIEDKLNEYLDKYKEEYQLNGIDLFRLRVLTLFSKLESEEEKENIRKDLKTIVKENNGKAHIILGYRFLNILFRVLSTFGLLFFISSPTNLVIAMFVNALVVLLMLLNRRWLLAVLFGLFGLIMYPRLPSHFLFFIGLGTSLRIYKKHLNKKSVVQ